jgi:hypothetical protein
MMDEAKRCGHRREVLDPKVAALPELGEDLEEIGAQFVIVKGRGLAWLIAAPTSKFIPAPPLARPQAAKSCSWE